MSPGCRKPETVRNRLGRCDRYIPHHMVARYLERRLEQLVEGLAGRVFRGAIPPGELASRLLREADLALTTSPAGPSIPNHFTVTIPDAPGEHLEAVAIELASFMEDAAAQRGWRVNGPVIVRLVPVSGHTGRPQVSTASVPGDRPPWAFLDFADLRVPISDNRVLVGRSDRADIVFHEPEISRIHALIYREGGRAFIEDQRSANGVSVDGVKTSRAELATGSIVAIATRTATFREV